jgi:hypothetical protein
VTHEKKKKKKIIFLILFFFSFCRAQSSDMIAILALVALFAVSYAAENAVDVNVDLAEEAPIERKRATFNYMGGNGGGASYLP